MTKVKTTLASQLATKLANKNKSPQNQEAFDMVIELCQKATEANCGKVLIGFNTSREVLNVPVYGANYNYKEVIELLKAQGFKLYSCPRFDYGSGKTYLLKWCNQYPLYQGEEGKTPLFSVYTPIYKGEMPESSL